MRPIGGGLEKLLRIHGYTYERVDDAEGARQAGVIAQEVEEVLPEVVHTNAETGIKSVAYGNLVALLIEAIRDLDAKVQNKLDAPCKA